MTVSLTNILLAMNILTLLHSMDEPAAFASHFEVSLVILLFEAVLTGIILALFR